MKLLRASFAASLLVSSFAACSPGKGADLDDDSGGGSANAGTAGALSTGGTNGGGAGPTGGVSGTSPTGGVSGTGLGGSAGASPTGGTAGVSGTAGAATGGAAGVSGGATGGVGGDGSGGTGGGGDAGGGAGGSGPGVYPGTIIIQDDFDASATIDAKWTRFPSFNPSVQPAIDTTRKHSGANAVRATGNSVGSFLRPTSGQLGGMIATGNRFYVRVWANFEKATSAVGNHSAFLVGATAESNGIELRLGMSSNQSGKPEMIDLNFIGAGAEVTRYSNGFTDGGNSANFPSTGLQFAANQWYCIEALFDGAASEFRLWVAEAEVMEMHVHDFSGNGMPRTDWGPMFTFVKIGAQDYSGSLGQVWYDDVFVGSAPIGCTR